MFRKTVFLFNKKAQTFFVPRLERRRIPERRVLGLNLFFPNSHKYYLNIKNENTNNKWRYIFLLVFGITLYNSRSDDGVSNIQN